MPTEMYKAVRLDRTSHYDTTTPWKVGEIVRPDSVDDGAVGPCGHGIHCSPTLLDAVRWQGGLSRYAIVEPIKVIASDASKSRCEAVRVIRWLHQAEQDKLAGFKLWEANHPINPLLRRRREVPFSQLLREWSSIGSSIGSSIRGSIWSSTGASIENSIWISIRSSIEISIGASVENSIWNSIGNSIRSSISIRDSMWAYVGGLFPAITKWRYAESLGPDPWRPLLTLWYGGYVPSFDGKTWRLHAGRNAQIVYEMEAGNE